MKKTLLSLFVAATAAFTATAQTNLVKNGDFEKWSNDRPESWVSASSASNAQLAQSTTAHSGTYSVKVLGSTSGNKRLATSELTLKPGTYTMTFFVKGETSTDAISYGYAAKNEQGKLTYNYLLEEDGKHAKSFTGFADWTEQQHTFTLAAETELSLLVMIRKGSTAVYVDDFKFTTTDGGLSTGGATEPETPQSSENVVYEIAFDVNSNGWTMDDIKLGTGLTYIWKHDAKYKYMKASAYKNSLMEAESILISPEINLGKDNKLTFEHAANKMGDGKPQDFFTLMIREGQTGEWKTLTIPTYPAGTDWKFISAGEIDLSAYSNKKVQLGFKYTSTNEVTGTWEIKNLKVTGTKPTSISTTQIAPAVETIYDLSGRRVNSAAKGIFIVNGKKVVH